MPESTTIATSAAKWLDLDRPTLNAVVLIILLLGMGLLYNRYQHKLDLAGSSQGLNDYEAIQKYLLTDETFYDTHDRDTKQSFQSPDSGDHKYKPILWIHLDYHYNARHWLSFGSRSSHHLNQPYLYITVKTIIDQCKDSFRICIIDDEAFFKLIPDWSIHLNRLSDPIKWNLRFLGQLHLLEKYGGMIVPSSFLCMRDLIDMYNMGTGDAYIDSAVSSSHMSSGKDPIEAFVVENHNRNVTASDMLFCPDVTFIGGKRGAPLLRDLIDFVQRTSSADYTDQAYFLGEYSRWCKKRIHQGKMKLIDGKSIGIKTIGNQPVLVDDWMSEAFIDLYSNMFGIYIPVREIMKRSPKFGWFLRMSREQLLTSEIAICKYMLLASRPDNANQAQNYLGEERLRHVKHNQSLWHQWMGYWQVPSQLQLWGQKPNALSGYLVKTETLSASKNGLLP